MARNAGLDLVEHGHGRTDLSRRAVAALKTIMLDEGGLHWMQMIGGAEPFDGRDLVALMHDREREAGINPPPAGNDRAGATLAVIAAFFAAGQAQMFA